MAVYRLGLPASFFLSFFCLIILAFSLAGLWRHTILSVKGRASDEILGSGE